MYIVFTLLALLPVVVGLRVALLAFNETLRAEGAEQPRRIDVIPAMRGTILDQAGRVLAVNAVQYEVAVDPTREGFSRNAELFYRRLGSVTNRSSAHYRQRVRGRSSKQYVLLARGLTESQKNQLDEWEDPAPWLIIEDEFARRYPYGSVGSHVVGHVNVDFAGLDGLEKQLDAYLRGENGEQLTRVDRRRRVSAHVGAPVRQPRHGEQVVLTIDLVRQAIVEEELARGVEESGSRWGTAIAMNPHTGAILAMANYPTYNPNAAGRANVEDRRNHAVTDQMELGSVMKLITSVALIDQGVMTLEDSLETGNGYWDRLRDTHGHGTISLREAISKSSNIALAKAGIRLDEGVFYQYFRNFGLGQLTGIELPAEVPGTLRKPKHWHGRRLSQRQMSIGYELDVTPLQMLNAFAAFANGGVLMQPYIVAERRDVHGQTVWAARPDSIRRVCKPETIQTLLPAFEDVVKSGTARTAQVDSMRIAGKTGTAQKAVNGRYVPGLYRATFAGFFPADDPEVVMIVVMDEPRKKGYYGGVVSAPVFQRVAKRWIGTFPNVASSLAPPDSLPQPRLLPEPEAMPRLATVAADVMPDLVGLGAREAVSWLAGRGVDVTWKGWGQVRAQQPSAGAPLPERVVLTGRSG